MVALDIPGFEDVQRSIDKDDIYEGTEDENGKYGLERNPHVTVVYGLPYETKWEEVRRHLPAADEYEGLLVGIGMFNNEKYDVLKYNIVSESLTEANHAMMSSFEVVNDYPDDYKPHATIAYLKPGKGKKYCRPMFDKLLRMKPKGYIWSNTDGEDQRKD